MGTASRCFRIRSMAMKHTAPQILKVQGNSKAKHPPLIGDWRYLKNGEVVFQYKNNIINCGTLNAIDNLLPNEVRHLKGDWIIKGDIPDGVTLKLSGGNLDVQGNLGKNVTLKNTKGFIHFNDAKDGCTVIANHGPVKFNSTGYACFVMGSSVEGHTIDDGTQIKSTQGDITLHYGEDGTQLISAKNITFHDVGSFSSLHAENGTLKYHTIGLKSEITAAHEICTRKGMKEIPSTEIGEAVHVGMVIPTSLCAGVSYDKSSKRFLLEFNAAPNIESLQAMRTLVLKLKSFEANMKAFITDDGHTAFMVAMPFKDPTTAHKTKQLIQAFVTEQSQRDPSPTR